RGAGGGSSGRAPASAERPGARGAAWAQRGSALGAGLWGPGDRARPARGTTKGGPRGAGRAGTTGCHRRAGRRQTTLTSRSPAWRPLADLLLPQGDHPLAAMASLLTTPSPGEELITTPILQATEARSPEAEASTALIAVVITVVFLTLLSVVILIFFYLYKNKGSYVTYEPAEGEPSAILQMESDSAKGREKEEYFI
uniref:Small cell adhesion glycoprotein n=1 Tax=Equus caballus TaxID=9796 RepID=A0A9L0T7F5_HORSE